MKRWISLLLCGALAACASAPEAPPSQTLFDDSGFAPPTQSVSADGVFALSQEMRAYLQTRGAELVRRHGRQKGLIEALYSQSDLRLDYETTMTRTAAEAFAARSGNCLSLVIMTAAFARELGLQVEYRSAYTDETWSRSGELYFRSGHVNVSLGRRLIDAGTGGDATRWTVDFLPASELRGLRTRPISESEVLAMYLNNRAAENLAQGRVDDAYWWTREAIRVAPDALSAYNTLGVVYQRRGLLARSEQAFNHVLARDPRHTRAMHNLAQVLGELGRPAERDVLAARLAQLDPDPPYRFFELGQSALRAGDYRAARDWFTKEVERADYSHEFHFWLGVAYFKLGDLDSARKHLQLALSNSQTRDEKNLYAAKLDRLKALQSP